MKKKIIFGVIFGCGLIAGVAMAAPGEYWEVTTKMDMAGMPFPMPATTTKVCIPVGSENDPRVTAGRKDKNCEMTDIRTVGNKTTWKMRCDNKGDIMTGDGEITRSSGAYQGKTHLSGQMDGEPVEMNQTYNGRKIGGACDTAAPPPALAGAKSQMEQACRVSGSSGGQLVYAAHMFLSPDSLCTDHKEQYCETVRSMAATDKETYGALAQYGKQGGPASDVAKACGIDLEAARQQLCRANSKSDFSFLEQNCPAEAKAYMEAKRREEERGRSYTGRSYTSSTSSAPAPQNNPVDSVLEGAKKLKGIFGF